MVNYRQVNKERIARYNAEWRKKNPDYGVRHGKKYRKENKEKALEYAAKWQKENPEKRLIYNQTRRARKVSAPGNFDAKQWQQKLEEHNYRCSYCYVHQDDLRKPLELEHIMPLSKGGHHIWMNIVPACGDCNAGKGGKPLLEYLMYKRETKLKKVSDE